MTVRGVDGKVNARRVVWHTDTEPAEVGIAERRGNSYHLRLDNGGESFRTAPRSEVLKTYRWQWWEQEPSLTAEPIS